jgi:hypothetical protein
MLAVSVAVRPIEPGDKAGLAAAFERLSDESRYRRFLSPHGRLSQAELRYLTEVDHHDHEALVALDPATLLLHRLADRARDEGISRFTALMLADNAPMAHLLADLGEAQTLDAGQGAVELAVTLPESGLGAALASWLRTAARGAMRLPG